MNPKLLGIASALLGFVSWTITTTLSDGLKSRTEAIERAIAQQNMDERFNSIQRAQQNLMKLATRVETRLLTDAGDAESTEARRLYQITSQLQWNDIAAEDIEATNRYAHSLASRAEQSDAPLKLRRSISQKVEQFDSIHSAYWQARQRFQAWMGNRTITIRSTMDAHLLDSLAQKQIEYSAVVERIWPRNFTVGQQLLSLNNELLQSQAKQLQWRRGIVGTLTSVAIVILATGTLLGILGKWIELRSASPSVP